LHNRIEHVFVKITELCWRSYNACNDNVFVLIVQFKYTGCNKDNPLKDTAGSSLESVLNRLHICSRLPSFFGWKDCMQICRNILLVFVVNSNVEVRVEDNIWIRLARDADTELAFAVL